MIFHQLDFLNTPLNQKFDCIISNPPYISESEFRLLDNGIKKFEPQIALTDNSDGLTFYKKLINESINLLDFGSNSIS